MTETQAAKNLRDAGMSVALADAVIAQMQTLIDDRVVRKSDLTDLRFEFVREFSGMRSDNARMDERVRALDSRLFALDATVNHLVKQVTEMQRDAKWFRVAFGAVFSAGMGMVIYGLRGAIFG